MEYGQNNNREWKKDDHKSSSPQIISLVNLLKKGIVYEEVSDFENSIYENVYTWAKEAVEQITADSREKEKYRQRSTKGKNTETSNVISFVGRRGTGKSSAMLSFQEALKKYRGDGKDECITFNDDAEMKKVRFFTLDCIDAAAMEKSESVFTLVLANILSKIEEHSAKENGSTDSYLMRSLLQKLGKIYKDYSSLAMQHSEAGVYSAYENLRNAASSQRIRTQFEQLVRECLRYFQQDGPYSMQEAYLVIAIDDLDMAHYNERATAHGRVNMRSYEIMREISKYFSIPGVIVLAAYNHTNLQRQCSGFFIGSNSDYYRQINRAVDTLRSGETLASEFMEKTFASSYRLYMPSWKKWDYFNQNIRIDIGSEGESDDLLQRFRRNKSIFKIKDFLKILYAEKTGVFYDCEGKKRHFLEVDSLRALNSTLYLLIGEDALQKKNFNYLHIVKENRRDVFKRVMDDVYFRFVNERLYLEEEKSLFYDLLELQIDRRSERIVHLTAHKIDPLGKNVKQELKLLYEEKRRGRNVDAKIAMLRDNSNVTYSYAELLHCIYHMTRMANIHTKEFVACLLHSYSVCLTQIYDRYITAKKRINKEDYIARYRYKELRDSKNVENQIAESEQYIEMEHDLDADPKYECLWSDENYHILDHNKMMESERKKKSETSEEDIKNYTRIDANYDILKGVIGKTVFGFWTQYYFPLVNLSMDEKFQDDQIFSIGAFSDIRDSNFHAKFIINNEDHDIKSMLNECIFFMTFYVDILQWNSITIDYAYKKSTGKVEMVAMSYDGESNFELTAFVKWTILYPDYLYKMEQLLTEAFALDKKDKDIDTEFKTKVRKNIKQLFTELWDCYYEWDKEYGGMILPIHNMDLMYNLVKHLFLEHEEQNDAIQMLKDTNLFLDEFSNMMQRILLHLHEIDKFYCLSGKDSFVEKFQSCPYIKLFGSIKKQEKARKFVEENIKYILIAVSNYCKMRKSSDE